MPPKKGSANAGRSTTAAGSTGTRPAATGTTMLPISRVHKIIKADKDVRLCSREAIFLISKTTEYMLSKVTQQAYAQARLQKRPRTVKYGDLASVAQRPEFFYLADVVPHTLPLNKALAMRKKLQEDEEDQELSVVADAVGNEGDNEEKEEGEEEDEEDEEDEEAGGDDRTEDGGEEEEGGMDVDR